MAQVLPPAVAGTCGWVEGGGEGGGEEEGEEGEVNVQAWVEGHPWVGERVRIMKGNTKIPVVLRKKRIPGLGQKKGIYRTFSDRVREDEKQKKKPVSIELAVVEL